MRNERTEFRVQSTEYRVQMDIVNMLRNLIWIDYINLNSVLCTLYSRLFSQISGSHFKYVSFYRIPLAASFVKLFLCNLANFCVKKGNFCLTRGSRAAIMNDEDGTRQIPYFTARRLIT